MSERVTVRPLMTALSTVFTTYAMTWVVTHSQSFSFSPALTSLLQAQCFSFQLLHSDEVIKQKTIKKQQQNWLQLYITQWAAG